METFQHLFGIPNTSHLGGGEGVHPSRRLIGRPFGRLLAVLAVTALVAAACGSSDDDADDADAGDGAPAATTAAPAPTPTAPPAPATTGETLEGIPATIFHGECLVPSGEPVVIYSGRKQSLIEPILEAFSCETGRPHEVRWGSSTEMALLLSEEGDRTEADVFLSRSPGPVGFLDGQGLLGTLGSDLRGLVADHHQAANGSWVGFSGRQRVLVRNLDSVPESELPSNIFELTEEKWRGRVAIPGTNGSFMDWFTVFSDQQGVDVATKWLNDMVANDAKYYEGNRGIVDAVGRGEIDVGLVNHYYNYQQAVALGPNHRAQNHNFDDVGSVLIITAASSPAASDNPEGAAAFISYLLSAGAQNYLTQSTYEYPVAAGVAPNAALPEATELAVGQIDYDSLGGSFERTAEIIEASGIANQ